MDVISVIIPVYNSEKYLDECLKSVLNQTYHSLEVIIVDDGSKDNSLSICKKFLNDKRVIVLEKQNGGAASARNTGMDKATGNYICFVDSDDVLEPDTYLLCIEAFEKYNPDYVVFGIRTEFGKIKLDDCHKGLHDEFYTTELYDNYMAGKYFTGYPTNKVWKTKKISSVRFDNDYLCCEDALFNWETMKYLKSALFFPKICYHYRYTFNSLSRNTNVYKLKTASEVWDILKKEAIDIGSESIRCICTNRIGWNIKMVKAIIQTKNRNYDWHLYREKLLEDRYYFCLMDKLNKVSIFLIVRKHLFLLRLWVYVEIYLKKVYLFLFGLKGNK